MIHLKMAQSNSDSIQPFTVSINKSDLDYLQMRLDMTRWPEKELVNDWSQGVPLTAIKGLCTYWKTEYDWRRCEAWLNSYPQCTTIIDGVEIYFLHIQSRHENATPLLLTHGWPGSVLEFRNVIDFFGLIRNNKDSSINPCVEVHSFSAETL